MMQHGNIKVEGHIGTWYVIDEREILGEKVYLLEHETYGGDTACVVTDSNGELLAEDIWNGLDEFEEDCYIEIPIFSAEKNVDGFYDVLGYRKEYVGQARAYSTRTSNATSNIRRQTSNVGYC